METVLKQIDENSPMKCEGLVMPGLFQQYEGIIIRSLITTFGLDFIIQDQYGGDVDTIHNVNQIGKNSNMVYKNHANEVAYDERGEYNSKDYHSYETYIKINRTLSADKKAGQLDDAYTGERFARNDTTNLDHVDPAKGIHDDRGRVLADIDGPQLANLPENLKMTNEHTNKSKKADDMKTFLKKHGDEYTEAEKKKMLDADQTARKAIEREIEIKYYTSARFRRDLTVAAGKVSVKMGTRQALGFVFTEIWFAVKEEFEKLEQTGFKPKEFLIAVGNGIKNGLASAKRKFSQLFDAFLSGAIAGALSSLLTSICNIFFTTAKNIVTIMRQVFPSLVEAAKVLFINPECYPFGERMRAVLKILATGASVAVGILVGQGIASSPIGVLPIAGELITGFCGTFVTGIMSCTLLYFLDSNKTINKLVQWLDSIPTVERQIQFYKEQAVYFEEYAAKLENINIDKFKHELQIYRSIADKIESAATPNELNFVLRKTYQELNLKLPWEGDFKSFITDKSKKMVFE
jgi:hypothetical protein